MAELDNRAGRERPAAKMPIPLRLALKQRVRHLDDAARDRLLAIRSRQDQSTILWVIREPQRRVK